MFRYHFNVLCIDMVNRGVEISGYNELDARNELESTYPDYIIAVIDRIYFGQEVIYLRMKSL